MTAPAFDADAARAHIESHKMWPDADDTAGEQSWWIDVLRHVTTSVNNYEKWDAEEFWEDRMKAIVDSAVHRGIGQARSFKKVLRLCESSHLAEVMDDPFDDEVYMRLTSAFEHPNLRDESAEREHKQRCAQMLKLSAVAEAYLSGAAWMVAYNWGVEALQAWCEAHAVPGPQT